MSTYFKLAKKLCFENSGKASSPVKPGLNSTSMSLICLQPQADALLETALSLVLCFPDCSTRARLTCIRPDYSPNCTVSTHCIVLWETNYESQVAMLRTGNSSGFKFYLVKYNTRLILPKESLGKLLQPPPDPKKKERERKNLIK